MHLYPQYDEEMCDLMQLAFCVCEFQIQAFLKAWNNEDEPSCL